MAVGRAARLLARKDLASHCVRQEKKKFNPTTRWKGNPLLRPKLELPGPLMKALPPRFGRPMEWFAMEKWHVLFNSFPKTIYLISGNFQLQVGHILRKLLKTCTRAHAQAVLFCLAHALNSALSTHLSMLPHQPHDASLALLFFIAGREFLCLLHAIWKGRHIKDWYWVKFLCCFVVFPSFFFFLYLFPPFFLRFWFKIFDILNFWGIMEVFVYYLLWSVQSWEERNMHVRYY